MKIIKALNLDKYCDPERYVYEAMKSDVYIPQASLWGGAPRSESLIIIIAGGNDTIIK